VANVIVTEGDVLKVVSDLLVKLGVEPELITGSAVLGRDLELDSTDAVEVGLEIKRRFDVNVKVQVKGGETIDDLIEVVLAECRKTDGE
jgi:acyl carrier protein